MKEILTALKDIVAPARCMGCLCEDTWLCVKCRMKISPTSTTCVKCEKNIQLRARGGICQCCRKISGLEGIVGAGPYGSPLLRRGIHWLKFKGITDVADDLATLILPKLLMIAPLSQLRKYAVLIPIPLHGSRLRQRGFNQSEVLSASISKLTKIPVSSALVRGKRTWSQAKLPHDLREQNMRESFSFEGSLDTNVKWVLLVDDVTTSAATLSAGAKALAEWEGQIWGVVVARR